MHSLLTHIRIKVTKRGKSDKTILGNKKKALGSVDFDRLLIIKHYKTLCIEFNDTDAGAMK